MIRDEILVLAFIAFFVALVIVGFYVEASVWNECRQDHSWLYCQHFMSSRR